MVQIGTLSGHPPFSSNAPFLPLFFPVLLPRSQKAGVKEPSRRALRPPPLAPPFSSSFFFSSLFRESTTSRWPKEERSSRHARWFAAFPLLPKSSFPPSSFSLFFPPLVPLARGRNEAPLRPPCVPSSIFVRPRNLHTDGEITCGIAKTPFFVPFFPRHSLFFSSFFFPPLFSPSASC